MVAVQYELSRITGHSAAALLPGVMRCCSTTAWSTGAGRCVASTTTRCPGRSASCGYDVQKRTSDYTALLQAGLASADRAHLMDVLRKHIE